MDDRLSDDRYRTIARELHDELGATHVTDAVAAWFAESASGEPCAVCAAIEKRLRAVVLEAT